MNKYLKVYTLLALFFLGGCTIRTYSLKKDRVDQDIDGNQGFLSGNVPANYQQEKKFTQRSTKVVEIELHNPFKFESRKIDEKGADISAQKLDSNAAPQETEPQLGLSPETEISRFDTYIVQKNDTLQKISNKPQIYGTTKKWMKIYQANKDKLSAPDKIYPGQKLKIPRE